MPDEPVLQRARVVHAGHGPLPHQGQVLVAEAREQVGRGHRPAREEVARHPVCGAAARLEVVGHGPVDEDVDEELPAGPQGAADPREQRGVVFHVFEHLDRDAPVEGVFFWNKLCGVGGDDGQVEDAKLFGAGVDELFLGPGVGDGDVAGFGELGRGEQGQGAPSAAVERRR